MIKSVLFSLLIFLGVVMLVAMTKLEDFGNPRGLEAFQRNWRAFRQTTSGKIWGAAYWAWLAVYAVVLADKWGVFDGIIRAFA